MKIVFNCFLVLICVSGLMFIEYRRQKPILEMRWELELLRAYNSQMAVRMADVEALEYFSHQRVAVSTTTPPIKKEKLLNKNIDIIITNEKGEPTEIKK